MEKYWRKDRYKGNGFLINKMESIETIIIA